MFPPFKTKSRSSRFSCSTQKITADYGINLETIKLIDSDNFKFNMTTETNNNSVFNHLRVPDAVKDLPRYEGNKRSLYDFIDNVEEILGVMQEINGTGYAKIILRAIRNKIIGEANDVLNMYGTPLNWDDIKRNLIIHYSDKRNETSLIRDLHLCSQMNDSVEKFYSKIIDIYSTIINHIKIHETDPNVIKSKQNVYEQMCLNQYLSGLREPLGSIIRSMRPTSLSEAFNYCLQEQNISYIKNSYIRADIRKSLPHRPSNLNNNINLIPKFPSNQYVNTNYSNNPNYPAPLYINPHRPPQNLNSYKPIQNFNRSPQNFNSFRHPQNLTSPQNSFQLNQSNFRPKTALPKPEPMDTSSNSKYKIPTQFNPYNNRTFPPAVAKPRFISEELFNLDGNQQLTNENVLDPYHNQQMIDENSLDLHDNQQMIDENGLDTYIRNEIDDQNFQLPASNTRSDT